MIGKYKTLLEQKKGKIAYLQSEKKEKEKTIEQLETEELYSDEALAFIQKVASETQQQVKVHIEDLITMALESILDEPYQFELDFVIRRNKTECDTYFVRDGERVHPMDASGGGAIDIASFASRIALWSLSKATNVLIFDEPFRFVSKEYQQKVGQLLAKLSSQLGLQIIMITHNPQFIQEADTVIQIQKEKGVSNAVAI